MTKRSGRGFTLIELLVVVLIIGILAAVSLPQYQKAVEKSRAAEALALLKGVYRSAESYYLENGTWPDTFDQLDVDIPWTGNISAVASLHMSSDSKSNEQWSLELMRHEWYEGVVITRLTGNYMGGQFQMWKNHQTASMPVNTVVCGELASGTYAIKEADLFCKKLFNSQTTLASGVGGRVYTFME